MGSWVRRLCRSRNSNRVGPICDFLILCANLCRSLGRRGLYAAGVTYWQWPKPRYRKGRELGGVLDSCAEGFDTTRQKVRARKPFVIFNNNWRKIYKVGRFERIAELLQQLLTQVPFTRQSWLLVLAHTHDKLRPLVGEKYRQRLACGNAEKSRGTVSSGDAPLVPETWHIHGDL